MKNQKTNDKKTDKSLDDYIKLAQEKTESWPKWKRNMFTPAHRQHKTA